MGRCCIDFFPSNSPTELIRGFFLLLLQCFQVIEVTLLNWFNFFYSTTLFFSLIVLVVVFNINMGHLPCLFTLIIEFIVSSPASCFCLMDITWCNLDFDNWRLPVTLPHNNFPVWGFFIIFSSKLDKGRNVNIFLHFHISLTQPEYSLCL